MNLEREISEIDGRLAKKEKLQDSVLGKARECVRKCAKAIHLMHKGEMNEAEMELLLAEKVAAEISAEDKAGEFSNTVEHAMQEAVEARVLLEILCKREISRPKWASDNPFLSGLADCVGELRRSLQLALKNGKKAEAEYYFKKMNEIYEGLMLLKYASSIAGPLKQKQDMVRQQVEKARSEMLFAKIGMGE